MNSVLIFVYKENTTIFAFAYIYVNKFWKNAKEVDKSGIFLYFFREGEMSSRLLENRVLF